MDISKCTFKAFVNELKPLEEARSVNNRFSECLANKIQNSPCYFVELQKARMIENEKYAIEKRKKDEYISKCKMERPDLWKTPERRNGKYILPLHEHPSMKRLRELHSCDKLQNFPHSGEYADWRVHHYEGF